MNSECKETNGMEAESDSRYLGYARGILFFGSPLLQEHSVPVLAISEDVRRLVADLTATLIDYGGAGLAAPQIGVNLRVIVLREYPKEAPENTVHVRAMINPEIISREGLYAMQEGCLSIPGAQGRVKRSATVVVSYLDLQGEAQEKELSGLQAVALQHEVDHLDGKLFVDHLSAFQRSRALEKHRKVMKKAYRQIRKNLR